MRVQLFLAICTSICLSVGAQCLEGDCHDGLGTFKYPSGAIYHGNFSNGKINGKGMLKFSNGNVYKGDWVDFYREGKGTLKFTDGSSYEGEFKGSKFNGFGVYDYANGDRYEGTWKDDLNHGTGVYLFYDGDRYEGNFEAGYFSGQGTMFYKNGAKYVGNWAENKKNGSGKFFKANGDVIDGRWANDKFASAASNSNIDDLRVTNTTTNSTGTTSASASESVYRYPAGGKFVGQLVNGEPNGKGKMFYLNGDIYEGEWENHGPHGYGVMHYHYGRKVGGQWKYGFLVEEDRIGGSDIDLPSKVNIDNNEEVKIRAVIVGVADYVNLPKLTYTDDDASEVYSFFTSPKGGSLPEDQIEILLDKDATREKIVQAMHRTFLQADENDVIVLYFSGHGFDGSFAPYDYNGYENILKHEEIKEIVGKSKAKHKLILADACHSGSMANNLWAARSANRVSLNKFYKKFDEVDGGVALLMSSKKEEISIEDHSLKQGLFSYYLIKGLDGEADKNADDFITITELYDYVTVKVRAYTAGGQNPVLFGTFNPNMPVAFNYKY